MDAHHLMLCVWLWLVCAYVECLPKVRLSSRQLIEGETPITIDFYVDDSVNATKEQVEDYLRDVILTTTADLQSYFVVDNIQIYYWIKYIKEEPGLKLALQSTKNTEYIYLDGAIDALKADFQDQDPPDIICLVTGRQIHNGDDVKKGYGYSTQKTLCETAVTMLLAYNLQHHNHISKMLAEMIRDSVDPKKVPYVHQKCTNLTDSMKNYLSKCKGSFEPEEPPEGPAQPSTEKQEVPETTPPSGPPSPPGPPPPPGPPAPSPETTTTVKPEAPKPEPPQPPETPEPTSTSTLTPDYC
uniref:Putative formin-like 2 n=1 Tax=Ixodes ricinus TaxID=34613 RepID=V5HE58_IXORI